MEKTELHIEYRDFFKILKKRFYIIIAIIIVTLGFSIFYRTQLTKPVYEAKVSIIIGNILNNDKSQFEIDDLRNSQVYMQTYLMILKTNVVAEKTIDSLGLGISADNLKKHIHGSPQPNTQFMEIRVRWGNPEEALLILDTLTKVFIEEAVRIYPTYTIKILEIISPRITEALSSKLYYLLTLIGALLISLLVVMTIEYLDNTIKTEEDIEKNLHIPVVGTIPKHKKNQVNVIESIKNNRYSSLDAYRTLRTNLYYISKQSEIKSIVITSAKPREGKSTATSMLGIVLAQGGKRTLLIDCDLRKPSIHELFDIDKTGLSNILMGESQWGDVIYESKVENLFVIPAGVIPINPVELLSSDKMKELLSELNEVFDYIVVDTPPVGLVTDAQILSQFTDGYLIVVSSGESDKEDTIKAQRLIEYAQGRIIGALLNKVPDTKMYQKYSDYYR